MADLLIAPERYTTPGGVPRKLLAGVFIVVSVTALAVFMLTSHDEPLMTGDQKARAELKKPESVTSQQKGNAHWVDEAAEHAQAGGASPLKVMDTRAAVLPGAPAVDLRPPAPMLPGFDAQGRSTRSAARDELPRDVDSAAVERERASRAAPATVFDDGAQPLAKVDGRLEGLPGELARHVGAGGMPTGPDALAPVIDAIKATHGQAAVLSRADGDRQWAQQLTAPTRDELLQAKPPHADLMLYQGTVIPCVLTRRINSDMPGVVTARVSMDVYDSRSSRRLLLPKGALLVGAYNSDVKQGQSRLQFAFTKLKMPDGATFDLPGATGSDAAGQAGVTGDVDRHFFRSFGAALLLGVLADRVTRITALPNGGAAGQGGVSATGQVFVDTARAELERHKGIPPTVTIEEGSRINVEVVRDMGFPSVYPEQQASW